MRFLHAIIALLLPVGLGNCHASEDIDKRPPNIIVIMMGDIGRDWLSCYGSNHDTPNIDRLAENGLKYRTAWSAPTSTPARVSLLTGMYPFHHGWTRHYDVPRWGGDGLKPDRFTTFASILRDSGYSTGIAGQWLLNDLKSQPNALKEHGFDEYSIWTGDQHTTVELGEQNKNGYLIQHQVRRESPNTPDAVNQFALDFIQQHREEPFLLYYPMLSTLRPIEADFSSFSKYVTDVDQRVGKLIQSLQKLGLIDHSLIILTSDNGSAVAGKLNGQDFIEGKGQRTDVGVHVPFIVRADFLTPHPGLESFDLVDVTDVYPTLLELAAIDVPTEIIIDGKSLIPSLSGDEDPFKKRNWIFSQLGEFRMIRDWQYMLDTEQGCYHLEDDPLQNKNLYHSKERIIPGRRARLQKILDRLPKNTTAPFDAFELKYPAPTQ